MDLERINYEKIKRRISTRWQQATGDFGQSGPVHPEPEVRDPERQARVLAGRGRAVGV